MTRDEQMERLANNTTLLVAELLNTSAQLSRCVESMHSVTEAVMATKREVHDALGPGGAIDGVVREVRHEISQANRQLAIISKDVDDVERVTREATGAFPIVKSDTKEGLLRAFGEL